MKQVPVVLFTMRTYLYIVTVVLAAVWGCGQKHAAPADANAAYYDAIKHLTGLAFEERLQDADSLAFWYYDDPDGDPNRYTRFYTESGTKDVGVVAGIKRAADKHFIRLERVKDCRSEGKIFFFKAQQPRQVLYFSTRGDSCSHFYFINDGWFYYMDMDTASSRILATFKGKAKRYSAETGD